MPTLKGFPNNKDKYLRLIDFFKEVLDICSSLDITPILDGSLAVFAYTGNQKMDVNDVDTSIPEADFPRVIKALEGNWLKETPRDFEALQKEFYQYGMGLRLKGTEPNDKIKHERLKAKLEILEQFRG